MADPASPAPRPAVRERVVLLVLATVQFTSIVDFMVIMPLGPELERALGLTTEQFSLVVSSYTIAAGLAGLFATVVLDRFARRPAFLTIYTGFLLGTLACGLARTYGQLLAARFLTGCFGGVLGGMALAIIGDVFPEERRGRATSALMSAFGLATILGVPIGLALGQRYGWSMPFVVLAVLGLPILFVAARALPRLGAHLTRVSAEHPLRQLGSTFTEPNHLRAFALTTAMQFGGFAVFPFLSLYLVGNAGVSREGLPWIYVVGGAVTLVSSPFIGRLADRLGKLRVFRVATPALAAMLLVVTNLPPVPLGVAMLAMAGIMLSSSGRAVPAMALITSSVQPHRRGGFLGANSAVQHISSGLGAWVAGLILTETAQAELGDASLTAAHEIHNFPIVGVLGAVITLSSVWFAGRLRLAEPDHATTAAASLAAAATAAVDADEPLNVLEYEAGA